MEADHESKTMHVLRWLTRRELIDEELMETLQNEAKTSPDVMIDIFNFTYSYFNTRHPKVLMTAKEHDVIVTTLFSLMRQSHHCPVCRGIEAFVDFIHSVNSPH